MCISHKHTFIAIFEMIRQCDYNVLKLHARCFQNIYIPGTVFDWIIIFYKCVSPFISVEIDNLCCFFIILCKKNIYIFILINMILVTFTQIQKCLYKRIHLPVAADPPGQFKFCKSGKCGNPCRYISALLSL